MMTGIIPGNRNADNIDAQLQECDFILFPNRSIYTYGFKAGLLKSFGFGQVGGMSKYTLNMSSFLLLINI